MNRETEAEGKEENTASMLLIDLNACIELNRPGDEKPVIPEVIQERMKALAEAVLAIEEVKDELLGNEPEEYKKSKAKAEEMIAGYEKILEEGMIEA